MRKSFEVYYVNKVGLVRRLPLVYSSWACCAFEPNELKGSVIDRAWSQISLKVDCSRDRTINGALRLLTRSGGRANINICGTCKENAVIQNPDACGSCYNSANRLVGDCA